MKMKDNFIGLNEKLVDSHKKEVKSYLEEDVEDIALELLIEDCIEEYLDTPKKVSKKTVKLSFGITDKTPKFSPKYQVYKSSKK